MIRVILIFFALSKDQTNSYICEEESKSVEPKESFLKPIGTQIFNKTHELYVIKEDMVYSVTFQKTEIGRVRINCKFFILLTTNAANFRYIVNFILKSDKELEEEYHELELRIRSGSLEQNYPTSFVIARSVFDRRHHMIIWSRMIEPLISSTATEHPEFLHLILTTPRQNLKFKIVVTATKPCTARTFECNRPKKCIDMVLRCDSHRHCPIYSKGDEIYCTKFNSAIYVVIITITVLLVAIIFIQYLVNYVASARELFRAYRQPQQVQQNPEATNITSSFLPRAPPAYDKKAKNARPSCHDKPPSFDEAVAPGVMPPINFAKQFYGKRDIYSSSLEQSRPETFISNSEVYSPEYNSQEPLSPNRERKGFDFVQEETPGITQTHQSIPESEQTHQESHGSQQIHQEAGLSGTDHNDQQTQGLEHTR